jgi:hypothetical protein
MSKVKMSLWLCEFAKKRTSYWLVKKTSDRLRRSAASRPSTIPNPRNGQVKGADFVGSRMGFTPRAVIVANTPGAVTMPAPVGPYALKLTWQEIFRFVMRKSALLFVTLKGISNGEPKEGSPFEKLGSVGHGGPTNAIMPRKRPTTAKKKALPLWCPATDGDAFALGVLLAFLFVGLYVAWASLVH